MSGTLSVAAAAGAAALALIAGTAGADTLLGSNYVGGSFGVVQFGDDQMDDMFGKGTGLSGFGSMNLNANMDLQVGAGYMWADGSSGDLELDMNSLAAGADLVYFFRPGQRCNPYMKAGLQVVKTELEVPLYGLNISQDDTEVGFGAGGGAEFEATKEILLRAGLDYFNIDSEDSFSLSGTFGYWFNPRILGFVGGSYDFESEDKVGEVGLAFKLSR